MNKRKYNYQGKFSFSLASNSKNLLERICENIDSPESTNLKEDFLVTVYETNPSGKILKDKNFPYDSIDKKGNVISYYRYNTLIRKTFVSPKNYGVQTFVGEDENAGLIPIRHAIQNDYLNDITHIIHGSLIRKNNQGVLITGNPRSGKTTLTTKYLENGADFIADENVLIIGQEGKLFGHYLPRTIGVRFSALIDSPLESFLKDINTTNATQYIDEDSIKRIINSKAFYVDAGLAISRRKFVEAFGVTSLPFFEINQIDFTSYGKFDVSSISHKEALKKLKNQIRDNKIELDPSKGVESISPFKINIPKEIELRKVQFENKNEIKW